MEKRTEAHVKKLQKTNLRGTMSELLRMLPQTTVFTRVDGPADGEYEGVEDFIASFEGEHDVLPVILHRAGEGIGRVSEAPASKGDIEEADTIATFAPAASKELGISDSVVAKFGAEMVIDAFVADFWRNWERLVKSGAQDDKTLKTRDFAKAVVAETARMVLVKNEEADKIYRQIKNL